VKGYKKWATPFVIYGMNAITVFVLAGVVGRTIGLIKVAMPDGTELSLQAYVFQTYYLSIASPINASLLYAISFILVMFLVVWFMWWRKWFVKV
jgi:predicted acyltransferase